MDNHLPSIVMCKFFSCRSLRSRQICCFSRRHASRDLHNYVLQKYVPKSWLRAVLFNVIASTRNCLSIKSAEIGKCWVHIRQSNQHKNPCLRCFFLEADNHGIHVSIKEVGDSQIWRTWIWAKRPKTSNSTEEMFSAEGWETRRNGSLTLFLFVRVAPASLSCSENAKARQCISFMSGETSIQRFHSVYSEKMLFKRLALCSLLYDS